MDKYVTVSRRDLRVLLGDVNNEIDTLQSSLDKLNTLMADLVEQKDLLISALSIQNSQGE